MIKNIEILRCNFSFTQSIFSICLREDMFSGKQAVEDISFLLHTGISTEKNKVDQDDLK